MLAKDTLAVILGGGVGSRLYPLTKSRSKPAVPIAGKFRLIDIPISNCLNTGINRMFVLTQFNSASLNRHVKNAFSFDRFGNGFVDILAAEQTPKNQNWFQGTADAVKQVVDHLDQHEFENVMILSGDQLYQMDFNEILQFHNERGADVTVATIPVVDKDAPGFGILKAGGNGEILNFVEKPSFGELNSWTSEVEQKYADQGKHYLASMGIYVFTKGILSKLFSELPEAVDFGKEFIPYTVEHADYKTFSFPFGGYWSDIGTIRSFFESNLMLTESLPDFNLYDNQNNLFTNTRMLSPSKFSNTSLEKALVADGCIIHAKRIYHAVIGIRSRIGRDTTIEDAIIMGNDYYQTINDLQKKPESELLGIGNNCVIKNTIVDKNARIGSNCTIIGSKEMEDYEDDNYCVRDGIVIIKKGRYIDGGTTIKA